MPHKLPTILTAALLLPAAISHAQMTAKMGPRVGLNLANVPFKDRSFVYDTKARAGAEVGVAVALGFGRFAVQPALLYSQKGFLVDDTYSNPFDGGTVVVTLHDRYRLNYFTVPLNLVYAFGENGQGIQVFGGPYMGFLLGGKYSYDDRQVYTNSNGEVSRSSTVEQGKVGVGDFYTTNRTDTRFYSRSFDYGLQAGVGYRVGGAQFQLGYSLGLPNLGADFKVNSGMGGIPTRIVPGPTYANRVVQVSFTYLLGNETASK